MKILLSLSLLFISCIVCKGQYIDSLKVNYRWLGTDSIWFSADSSKYIYQYLNHKNEKVIDSLPALYNIYSDISWDSWDSTRDYRPIYDTLKVLYEYSDTSKIVEFETLYSIDTTTGEVSSTPTLVNSMGYYDNKVRWSNGYVVTESTIYLFRRVCYLDKDKQPLYKNIIVWKYIEIE